MRTLRFSQCFCAAIVLTIPPAVVHAQGDWRFLVGLGYASTEGNVTLGKSTKQFSVQLGLPQLRIALRGDAILFGGTYDIDALTWLGNVVVPLRIKAVEPYAILGFGSYATTLTERKSGWNYGAGIRWPVSRFGLFAEYRRHEAAGRSVTVAGVSF